MGKRIMQIMDWLKDKKHLLVVSHVAPDGDAIGSVSGMAYIVESMGIKVTAFVEEVPEMYAQFAYPRLACTEGMDLSGIDGIVCVDCANTARLHTPFGDWSKRPAVPVLNIDHHYTNELYGDVNDIHKMAATCEIIAKECEHEFVAGMLPEPLATALYMGIVTDTGCFKFNNVSKSVFEACAYLMDNEARHEDVVNQIYFNKPRNQVEFEANMMENALYYYDERLIIAQIYRRNLCKFNVTAGQIEECTQRLREIGSVKAAVRLIESDTGVRISFRSKDSEIDVSLIAKQFNGGGHKMAAGAFIEGVFLAKATDMIVEAFKEVFG